MGVHKIKGGIKGTLNIYKDGGIKGRPVLELWNLVFSLFNYIKNQDRILYDISRKFCNKDVKGLFGFKEIKNASINYKIIEECCILDYKEKKMIDIRLECSRERYGLATRCEKRTYKAFE